MAETALESGVQTTEEVDASPNGRVRRWLHEWNSARAQEKEWREEAEKVWTLYQSKDPKDNSFNILWSNTETLRPACYNSTPRPDVRRRFRDADPQGKVAATVLERALTYSVDADNFDHHIQMVVLDVLLPSRGVARIRYEPVFESVPAEADSEDWLDEEPEPEERVVDESAPVQHVVWNRFRHGPGKTWDEVTWVGFEHEMPYDELVRKFGREMADKLPLSKIEGSEYGDKDIRGLQRTACVIEIWDKTTRRAMFFSEGYKHGPLLDEEDPLNLTGFFPVPRPIYAIEDATTLVPGILYKKYEAQANELNRITLRINKIINALKVRGAYSAHLSEVGKIIEANDNEMVAIENASEIANMGGLDKAIWIMPVDRLVQVLGELYKGRAATLQTIYEITGLGDVMRGVSNPHETLGAQKIKSQWGSLRLQRLQREIQRFIRDLVRMKAEIISEHFSYQTLANMTGVQLPTNAEKQQIQQVMQMAATNPAMAQQMQAQSVQMQKTLQTPSWEDVMELLKSDSMRQYRIDIETDSTINETVERDAQGMQEAINAIVQLFGGLAPAIQAGYLKVDVAKSLALAVARTVRMGAAVEDAVEQIEQPPPQSGDPEQAAQQMEQLQKQLQQATGEVQKAQQRVQQLEAEKLKNDVATSQMTASQQLKDQHAQQMARLESERQAANSELTAKNEQLRQIVERIKDAEHSLELKKRDIAVAETRLGAQRTEHESKARDVESGLRERLTDMASASIDKREKDVKVKEENPNAATEQVAKLEESIAATVDKITQMQDQVAEQQNTVQEQMKQLLALVSKPKTHSAVKGKDGKWLIESK